MAKCSFRAWYAQPYDDELFRVKKIAGMEFDLNDFVKEKFTINQGMTVRGIWCSFFLILQMSLWFVVLRIKNVNDLENIWDLPHDTNGIF